MVDRVVAASAPVRVQAHLRDAPDGAVRVLHRGPDAVYVEVSGRCVGVLGRGAVRVPCAVRTDLDALPSVRRASVTGGVLLLDGVPVVVGRFVDVGVPRIDVAPGRPGHLDVAGLIGRGDGLTPYGDDVVCGWLAAHRAAGVATPEVDAEVRSLMPRTTLLSATLLDCALHGEVVPELGDWLAGRGTAEAVARIGHSSGRGLLEGARRALADLTRVAA